MVKLSRRSFLKAVGSASVASGVVGVTAFGAVADVEATEKGRKSAASPPASNKHGIKFSQPPMSIADAPWNGDAELAALK